MTQVGVVEITVLNSLSQPEYRNQENSQTTLEAETDEARSKGLKMQVTENKEISSIEKSTLNIKPRSRSNSRPTNKTKDVKTL